MTTTFRTALARARYRLRVRRLRRHDEIDLVAHLEELRVRLFVCVGTAAVAFVAAFAVHGRIVRALAAPLPHGMHPVTFGVAEPVMTSLRVSMLAAVIVTMPVVLWQAWAYVAPALDDGAVRSVTRVALLGGTLFALGATFGYLVALPGAVGFLVHYDASLYRVQLRAQDYFTFAGMVVAATGLVFELPVAMLALVRVGVLSSTTLRRRRRVGYAAMAAIAVALPGVDPVLTAIEFVPLLALYELTTLAARRMERVASSAQAAPLSAAAA